MSKSKLINDLHSVPDIIAALGLSVAEAQRRLNVDYVENLEKVVVMAQSLLGGYRGEGEGKPPVKLEGDDASKVEAYRTQLLELLATLAPPRYQFTQTTLTVRLDLAQSLKTEAQVGVSAGVGAVAVNAALTIGYGFDYRAAAECQTVLQAVLPDPTTFRTLLESVKGFSGTPDKGLTLPDLPQIDKDLHASTSRIFQRMTGFLPAPVEEEVKEKLPTPGNG